VQTIIIIFTAGNRNRRLPPSGSSRDRTPERVGSGAPQGLSATARPRFEDSGD
jgi:hypothetical protein